MYSVLALCLQLPLSLSDLLSQSPSVYRALSNQKTCNALRALAPLAGFSVHPVLPPLLHSFVSSVLLGGVAVVLVLGIPSDPDICHSRVTPEITKRFMSFQLASVVFVSARPPALPSSAIGKITDLCSV